MMVEFLCTAVKEYLSPNVHKNPCQHRHRKLANLWKIKVDIDTVQMYYYTFVQKKNQHRIQCARFRNNLFNYLSLTDL